jgi:ubiquitin C-terminal hydrolase
MPNNEAPRSHSQTRRARKVEQESNYEGRLAGLPHTTRRRSYDHQQKKQKKNQLASFVYPVPKQNIQSSFKAEPPISTMATSEPPPQAPPSAQEISTPASGAKGAVGIANIGNTCYMNATLQALRSSLEMTAFFLENKHEEYLREKSQDASNVKLTKSYIELLHYLWSGNQPQFVRPEPFFQSMCASVQGTVFEQFRMKIAHDSHEFLVYMMDTLHSALAEEVNITITRAPPVTETDKMIQLSLQFWKQSFEKSYSPFVDVLYGLYQREMHCQACDHKSYSWEVFNCLKVGLPDTIDPANPPSIQDLLKQEIQDETIEGYACDKCSPTRTTAIRHTHLWKLPRTLFVVLKRFTPTGQKNNAAFTMNHEDTFSFTEYFNPHSPEPSRSKSYSLFATIDHHGVLGGGHYTAQALNLLDQKWYGYDDDSVYTLEKPTFGRSTYILAFRSTS